MNSVYHEQAVELYGRCRVMMRKCINHAIGGKHACDICSASSLSGDSPCLAHDLAVIIEHMYEESGGDPVKLTAKPRSQAQNVKID